MAERTQQAGLLNLTHDTIFVRAMSDVITYWNHGAQELYGWTSVDAIGKRSHDLLRTVFPAQIDGINAELLRTGRWEGELRHVKADETQVVVSSRWSLRHDERERAVAILEANNDITERKRREQEIESLNQELANAPRSSNPSARNWKRLPIPSRMTCGRLFATWLAILSCFKKRHPPAWTKKVITTS